MNLTNAITLTERQIGLIADTHDELDRISQAVVFFKKNGISTILHAGDVCSAESLSLFKDFNIYVSLGNTDNHQILSRTCQHWKLAQPQEHFIFRCQFAPQRIIFLFHGYGEQVPVYRSICCNHNITHIIKGHTHLKEDFYKENTRIINPGALHRCETISWALFDTLNDKLIHYNA